MSREACQRMSSSAVVLCVLCALPGAVKTQQKDTATAHLRPQHREVVEGWLARRPDLRLATVADCLNKDGLAATRQQFARDHHPYYAVGDFNRDRREDFAVALVNKRKRKNKFAVAIYNGHVSRDSVPAFFEEDWDLSDGGLFGGRDGVTAGPFESDNCVILRPRAKRYIVKNCLEE